MAGFERKVKRAQLIAGQKHPKYPIFKVIFVLTNQTVQQIQPICTQIAH